MKGRITVEGNSLNNWANKKLVFKNNAPFRLCISKINNTFVVNEDYDIDMPMYNLLEYNDNYSMTSGNVNNYRDEVNDATNEDAAKYTAHNNKIRTSRSFEYKVKKMTGKTSAIATRLDTKVIVSLKYLSNF